jgi:hypothetical protein
MGIEADKVDEIIVAHTETVDALKEKMGELQTEADKVPDIQKKLDKALKQIEDAEKDGDKNPWKVKYDAIKEEFGDYKKNVEAEKSKTTKTEAFKKLLQDIGISEKRIDAVVRVSDIESINLDAEGNIEGVDDLKKSLASEWEDFIVKSSTKGADTTTPPANNGGAGKKTKEEIMAIKDTVERQQAMLENKELFLT